MSYIELRKKWGDDDGMLLVEIVASNGSSSGTQEFYVYPSELENFGKELQDFPKSLESKAVFEYGLDPKLFCYVLIQALVLGRSEGSAFEVSLDNRQNPPSKAVCHFYLTAEPASINRFGKSLVSWAHALEEVLRAEFHT